MGRLIAKWKQGIFGEAYYYPFGLTMSGISSKSAGGIQNRKKYNGMELQNGEFSDGIGLEMYEYKYRFYDHQIGRFISQDKLADKYVYYSPYQFAGNEVPNAIDLDGLEPFRANAYKNLWKNFVNWFTGANKPVHHFTREENIEIERTAEIIKEATNTAILLTTAFEMPPSNSGRTSIIEESQLTITSETRAVISTVKSEAGVEANVVNKLGDLTHLEVKAIQTEVNRAGRPIEIVGSAAKGTRRNVESNFSIGKGIGTKSDIDPAELLAPLHERPYCHLQRVTH